MYYCVNIFFDKKCIRTRSSRRRVRSESTTYSKSTDSISFSYIPVASQCISLLKPSVYWLQWGWFEQFFQCFETRRSLDKCCDYVPPTDAQRLWGWMEEWAGLDSGLLRDDWRVCRKTASPFDWQQFCTIKKSLKLFELSPIAEFASVFERQTAAVFLWLSGRALR